MPEIHIRHGVTTGTMKEIIIIIVFYVKLILARKKASKITPVYL